MTSDDILEIIDEIERDAWEFVAHHYNWTTFGIQVVAPSLKAIGQVVEGEADMIDLPIDDKGLLCDASLPARLRLRIFKSLQTRIGSGAGAAEVAELVAQYQAELGEVTVPVDASQSDQIQASFNSATGVLSFASCPVEINFPGGGK